MSKMYVKIKINFHRKEQFRNYKQEVFHVRIQLENTTTTDCWGRQESYEKANSSSWSHFSPTFHHVIYSMGNFSRYRFSSSSISHPTVCARKLMKNSRVERVSKREFLSPFSRCLIGFCAVNETRDVAYNISINRSWVDVEAETRVKWEFCDISIHDKMNSLLLSFDNLLFLLHTQPFDSHFTFKMKIPFVFSLERVPKESNKMKIPA